MDTVDFRQFTRLLDEQGPALALYARQWCRDPEDIVQEAFLRLMRQRPAPVNVIGWLYRVVRNEAISSSRAEARRTRHEESAAGAREPWFAPSSADVVDAKEVASVLHSLPIEQREVIALRLWAGLSFEEIAELTGKSTSTAHRRYVAGLTALRQKWSIPCLNQNEKQT